MILRYCSSPSPPLPPLPSLPSPLLLPSLSELQAAYSRKKASNKLTKKSIFRFDSSRHALSVSSYLREQRDIELAKVRPLVDTHTLLLLLFAATNFSFSAFSDDANFAKISTCKN